jgi:hypothetical protein
MASHTLMARAACLQMIALALHISFGKSRLAITFNKPLLSTYALLRKQ